MTFQLRARQAGDSFEKPGFEPQFVAENSSGSVVLYERAGYRVIGRQPRWRKAV